MSEIDELRREILDLRLQLSDAHQAIDALAHGEVDAVAQKHSSTPLLLEVAQKELRQSRSLLRAVFDGSPDALLLANDQGVHLDANSAACVLFAQSREQILGQPAADFGAAMGLQWPPVIAGTKPQNRRNVPWVPPDGTARSFEYDIFGNVSPGLHLMGLRDVTERTAIQEAVARSEARFRALTEKSADGISILGPEGDIRYMSPSAARIIGTTPEEMLGRSFRDYIYPPDLAQVGAAHVALVDGAPDNLIQFRAVRADGAVRWIEAAGRSMLSDPDIRGTVGNFRDITERKAVEEERDGFFRLSLDLLCIAGMDGSFRRLNPAWESTLGWSLDEILCRPWLDMVHPEDRAATTEVGSQLANGEVIARFENRYLCKDGSYRRLQWSCMPSPEEGLIYACAHDVTEERATARRDRLLFSSSPVPMWLVDAESRRFVDVNEAALANYGYNREEFLSLCIEDIVIQPQLKKLKAWLHDVSEQQDGYVQTVQRRHRTRSGEYRDVEVSGFRLEFGQRTAILCVVLDVTERKRMEDQLRASERRYRRIVDNASEGIWMYDASGKTTFVNPSMAEMLGCSVEEAVGKPIFSFIAEEFQPAARDRLADPMSSSSERSEFRVKRSDDVEVWVVVHVAPLLDDQGHFESALALATDVTERKRSEAALALSDEQLRQSQKMEAVGSLAGGIAHDFNNLLSVVLSYTALLMGDLQPTDPVYLDLAEIHRAGQRATELTRQLLAFSRKQILQPAVINLNSVATGVKKMLDRLLGEDVELSILTSPNLGNVFADQGQIEQVIMNLVVNARDAMPLGGSITIETSNVTLDESYAASHAGVVPGRYVQLAVSDTGTGMDRTTQERIFEPFFTTKELGKGTGLGLSTVYGIVQQSGGHIWLYSEPGHGTTFKIYLRQTDKLAEETLSLPPAVAARRGTETILLVEDEDLVRDVVRTILSRSGYHVLEARNGGEAFLLCEQFNATIHLLLTDVVMPRMSGRQLAERLESIRPRMKVLYISGYTENTIVHHGVLDSGVEFLPKPIMPEALLRKVREVLDAANSTSVRI